MPKMAVIGLDLGGTKLAAALFTRKGRILRRRVVPLEGRQGRAVGDLICAELKRLLAVAHVGSFEVSAVGVSVPGISNLRTGRVWAPNIPGWQDYPLRRELQAAVPGQPIRVVIDSDRACYILGEAWRGVAKGCRNAIFLAVGTGIGAGILIDGQVLRGAHDIAGAVGWLALARPFQREYRGCGCFEYHASGLGLARAAQVLLAGRGGRSPGKSDKASGLQAGDGVTARDVFAACERGDPVAGEVIARAVGFWGMAVANLVSLFNPEMIILGGGVFGPAARLLDNIYAEARKWAQPIGIRQVKLRPSRLGPDAGLYGAGCLALRCTKPKGEGSFATRL